MISGASIWTWNKTIKLYEHFIHDLRLNGGVEEGILLLATRIGATTGHNTAATCRTSRSWQEPTRSQQHCQKGGFRQPNQCNVPSYTTATPKATNRPRMWPTAPQAAQNCSHIRGNGSRPNTLRYAVHNDLVVRVTDKDYPTMDRVLHKLLTIMSLRLSQTSIRRTRLSIHSWDPSRKNNPRLMCALKELPLLGSREPKTLMTHVSSHNAIWGIPEKVSWRRKVKERHIALRSQRSKEEYIDQSHTSVLTHNPWPWLHNSQFLSSRGPGGGTNSNCASVTPCDKQCAVTVLNVLLYWTASIEFVSGVFGRHVGSIFRNQDVQNSSWTLLPPPP